MIRSRVAALLLTAASVFAPSNASGQSATPSAWQSYLAAFDAYVRADSIVGAATLVMRDGRVLANHEIGFADAASRKFVSVGVRHDLVQSR